MDKPAWELAKRLFHEAVEETGSERMKLLETACGDDRELLAQVMALLQAHEEAGDFLSEGNLAPTFLSSGPLPGAGGGGYPPGLSGEDPEPDQGGWPADGLPARIGPYEILGLVGTGGMGKVYRARDPKLKRDLAIKVLPAGLVSHKQVARFEREANLLASLNHPNIATIHSFGEADGRPYLVLELIEGKALSQRLEDGPLSVEEAARVGFQIAEAMEAAHEAGIVHRDLKPANVMTTPRGLVKVLDFGIAKTAGRGNLSREGMEITGSGIMVGTIPYLSPEQIVGDVVDERSDLWALGCVLFEALTGRSPFLRPTSTETLVAIQKESPDLGALPGRTPEALKRLISECLQKNPRDRPTTARAVRESLSDILAEMRAPRAGPWARMTPAGRAVWVLVGILATITVLSLAEGGILRTLIGLMPHGARFAVLDGGRLAAIAVVLVGAVLLGARAAGEAGTAGPRRRSRSGIVALAAVLGLALVYPVWRWIEGNVANPGRDAIDVYVSLPFQGLDDEDAEYLLSISTRYRSTLETVFSEVGSVNILPASYDPETMRAFPPQCTFQRVRIWLSDSGIDPDLVLCNDVNVFSDPGGETGLRVVSSLQRAYSGTLEPVGRIESLGSDAEIRYLALWTGARILQTLRQRQFLRLTEEEERAVLAKILEEYSLFLSLQGDSGSEVAQVVDGLRNTGPADGERRVEEVIAALDVYETNVSLDEDEARVGELRKALLRRVGGAQ